MNIEDAKQLAKQGDREGAIAMLRQMLEQNEGERELVLLELGVVYNAMGETMQAINHLNEVMRINPENIKAKAYLDMINGILDYYCKDLLNPWCTTVILLKYWSNNLAWVFHQALRSVVRLWGMGYERAMEGS